MMMIMVMMMIKISNDLFVENLIIHHCDYYNYIDHGFDVENFYHSTADDNIYHYDDDNKHIRCYYIDNITHCT